MPISEILQHKYILAVDDEPDVIEIIREELAEVPDVTLHTAQTFELAREYLVSYSYDLVILDIMGVQGFDLLKIAVGHKFPVVMLTAHALNPEALKQSIELGARAYLPKDKLGAIIPFLEDVLQLSYRSVWRKALDHVAKVFDSRYGSDWRTSEKAFWDDFEKKLSVENGAIIE